jgi:hypothetical protein
MKDTTLVSSSIRIIFFIDEIRSFTKIGKFSWDGQNWNRERIRESGR